MSLVFFCLPCLMVINKDSFLCFRKLVLHPFLTLWSFDQFSENYDVFSLDPVVLLLHFFSFIIAPQISS
jgi:hypothetical protein